MQGYITASSHNLYKCIAIDTKMIQKRVMFKLL